MAGEYDKGFRDGFSNGRQQGKEEGYSEGFEAQAVANADYTNALINELDETYEIFAGLVKDMLERHYARKMYSLDELKKYIYHYLPETSKTIDMDRLFQNTFDRE